jgi:hypothetical protein
MPVQSTCRHCARPFTRRRAGALYCSNRCRTAACRKRAAPLPLTLWSGHEPRLSETGRAAADGQADLPRAELGERLLDLAETADNGDSKTGRRYYYLALSHGYVSPDMSDTDAGKKSRNRAYKTVTEVLGILRKQGRLAWDMVLDLTREIDQWSTYRSPGEARAALKRRYDEDRWLGQDFYPILIAEKDTLEPILQPVAYRWQIPFASSRGYGSLKLQHDVAKLLYERYVVTQQPALVLFVSDLDPSGLDLQRAWEEALGNFDVRCTTVRLGLTPGQVSGHGLDALGIEVKPSDSRAKDYVAQYGNVCWEADVLPASVLSDAVHAEIEARLDRAAWDQRDAEIEVARRLL